MSSKFQFFDLFNWELRCLWEDQQSFEDLKLEDEAFLKQNKHTTLSEPHEIKTWLSSVSVDSPTQSFAIFCSAMNKGLSLLFFILGASFCFSVLTQNPVDLSIAMGLLLGLQLVFLGIVIFTMLFSKSSGPFGELLLSWSFRSPAVHRWLQEKGLSIDTFFNIFRRHQKVLKWQLSTWTQSLAVTFHLGLIFAFISRVIFSDLKFVWSTSLPLTEQAQRLNDWMTIFSYPWIWFSSALPSTDMLLSSHQTWNLNEQRWWPWVMMMLLCYGLIPRVLLAIVSKIKSDHYLQYDLINDSRINLLKQRFNAIQLGWSESKTQQNTSSKPYTPANTPLQATPFVYIQLFNFPLKLTELNDLSQIRLGSNCIEQWKPELDKISLSNEGMPNNTHAWLCPIEDWQVPSKKIIRYLKDLREMAGENRLIIIALCSLDKKHISENRLHLWRSHCAQTQDSFLRVEVLS